ncbi:WYL domain-containing protein [Actinoalloteichus sp. AHMU CJ021]|uniref:helix-turn-helix transcriptional regulator n=1 Tax=Actinoalloteichus sp. AHMU CJ021 TaxID=2072503 RepID=UPI000CA0503E|nr:WYL domain-containing protein [Actinoalloteichus sp. AHMU CJ021]
MRADRLVAILMLMRTRARVTAAELAAELEVSVSTARRDLEALSSAGVPVYPSPGRHGGWSLVGGARTDLSGLTAGEATALFLLAGPGVPMTSELRSAMRKLLAALPRTFRGDAEAASGALLVDPVAWGGAGRVRPPLLGALRDAVVRGRRVRLTYSGRTESTRLVDPWGLVDKDGTWYLVGGTERGRRSFRVDRVVDVLLTDEAAHRPPGFDLSEVWGEVVRDVEGRRSGVVATVLVVARYLSAFRAQWGRHCEVAGEGGDGRVRVRVSAHRAVSVAEQLAGWGAVVEVVEPASVRDELARIGAELVGRYGPAAEPPGGGGPGA